MVLRMVLGTNIKMRMVLWTNMVLRIYWGLTCC